MERRVSLLQTLRAVGREGYLGDLALQAQVERHLQIALQAAIDVALHVVSSGPGRPVEGYGDAFLALGERGVLEPGLARRLRVAAGLRNVLVHGYTDVDPGLVHDGLGRLDDLRGLALAVEQLLDDPSAGTG